MCYIIYLAGTDEGLAIKIVYSVDAAKAFVKENNLVELCGPDDLIVIQGGKNITEEM